jgi:hypothetical protein
MAFNVHITAIAENPNTGQKPSGTHLRRNSKQPGRGPVPQSALVTVPADHAISKVPVRIFNIQPQE